MYAYIKGILVQSTVTHVVLDVAGIGYKIYTPTSAFGTLPKMGSELLLFTSFVVREQAETLYGFKTESERDFFEALLNVTGIGPKIALALIGHLPLKELQRAIVNRDTTTLCRVPGIGKKGGERLIIEMRDKVEAMASDLQIDSPCDPTSQTVSDAMSALINLGYTQATAQKAVKKTLTDIPEGIDIAQFIACALKHV
jgi:Holliday junction DNA helicase RuvA